MRVLRSGSDVFIIGRFEARVQYECVRCLGPFEETVGEEFHRVLSEKARIRPDEVELRQEDLELEPIPGRELDLSDVLSEQLYLALRPFPTCRDECRGLCPRCGVNRNAVPCSCSEERAGTPFAALKDWHPRQE